MTVYSVPLTSGCFPCCTGDCICPTGCDDCCDIYEFTLPDIFVEDCLCFNSHTIQLVRDANPREWTEDCSTQILVVDTNCIWDADTDTTETEGDTSKGIPCGWDTFCNMFGAPEGPDNNIATLEGEISCCTLHIQVGGPDPENDINICQWELDVRGGTGGGGHCPCVGIQIVLYSPVNNGSITPLCPPSGIWTGSIHIDNDYGNPPNAWCKDCGGSSTTAVSILVRSTC